ncbi:MAG: DUF2294 domain-containing protein [Elainellaceae cyanobacterium]
MDTDVLTRGQLERRLSQRIQALYREQLSHQPAKVSCEIFDQKIAILIEGSLTPTEQLLVREGRHELLEDVRTDLDDVIRPKLRTVIEEVLGVEVVDLMSDATPATGRSGIIAVLSTTPEFREPKSRSTKSDKSSLNGKSG